MEATEWLNTVFNQIRTSMNRMSQTMKNIFLVPQRKSSGKTIEPRNNRAHDKAAAKAATKRIVAQGATSIPITGMQQEEHARLVQSHREWESDENYPSPRRLNIHKNIHSSALMYARGTSDERVTKQSRTCRTHDIRVTENARANFQESAQNTDRRNTSPINTQQELGIPESIERSRCSIKETQSIDMNALREEIKETISATIKEKLRSDADSVTTVSHSMTALDANAQYWRDLSNKATHRSRRALELQLKMAEEKVNTLLYEEAPEEALLEATREAHHICFQLDQNTHLREAGLMPEQQVKFRTDTGGSINNTSREYGVNPIHELDGAVVNRMAEYSGIQQMVRQAIKNASHETEPEKSFLAKAGVKMGNPPNYSSERNLEKFENWVASVLRFRSMYNLLGPQVCKVQLQFLGQCLTDEAQEWFYRNVEQFD
ncbi:hypothetical protein M422DRAFT_257994 [Sphaerobolus stellatus SS14]|uniref:Uncharacterized protein n=1 Tax=Sphaerobolus stellatus (strain SS14) TaxID=990650 RepID=A0A0C9UW67_SPHS4|nr:hypothetical protein M422DRAFT_257994 [Sphaerobolus stellatus SS14]